MPGLTRPPLCLVPRAGCGLCFLKAACNGKGLVCYHVALEVLLVPALLQHPPEEELPGMQERPMDGSGRAGSPGKEKHLQNVLKLCPGSSSQSL